jgi:hypothetical protein
MLCSAVMQYLVVNKWIYDIDRGLRLECKHPQQSDTILKEKYGYIAVNDIE